VNNLTWFLVISKYGDGPHFSECARASKVLGPFHIDANYSHEQFAWTFL